MRVRKTQMTMENATEPADPDRSLVLACQDALLDGRSPPFRELYERHHARVYRQCLRILGNEPDARDASQDTFHCVMRRLPSFQYRSRFTSWLHTLTLNCCRDLRRARHRWIRSWSFDDANLEAALRAREREQESPTAEISRRELETLVERCIACLSPTLRSVVVPRYLARCSYVEIAVQLGISVGTVKSRLFRAHAILRDELSRRLEHEEPLARAT